MIPSRLPYRFQRQELLEDALTHRSAGHKHNERLEFLGDGVLNFIIAAELYTRVPDADEGELSRLRASLVRRETLAGIAQDLDLGAAVILGPGEQKSGGQQRQSILADTMEAVLGAVFLDGGYEACRAVILTLFETRLDNRPSLEELKDPKTRLQEYLQSKQLALPEYRVEDAGGAHHARVFEVACTVPVLDEPVTARGRSRRKAEQAAARAALKLLGVAG